MSDRWWRHCEGSVHILKHGNRGCKHCMPSFEVLGHISSHVLLNLKKTEPLPLAV
jgi:hypothetical protein